MRVITGSFRGKLLAAPSGLDTRPTTGRIKESIFNIVQFLVPSARVLDLFAGSGQMGIEAMSRGAESCVFVENGRSAIAAVRKNIENCKLEGRAVLEPSDALAFLARADAQSFDLIFLDPPYGGKLLNDSLKSIYLFDILANSGIILCEMSVEDTILEPSEPYQILREYVYGNVKIVTIVKKDVE